VGDLAQIRSDHGVRRIQNRLVFDEVAEMRILFFADWRFQRDWLLGDLQDLAHLRDRNVHLLGDLFARRFATEFLHQRTRSANQFVDRFDHVHRNTDGARLIGDGASDRLANPPSGVSRKLVTPSPFELIHGFHQTDIAFLNQIEELQTAVRIFLRDGNDQTEVRFNQFALRLAGLMFARDDCLKTSLHFDRRNLSLFFVSRSLYVESSRSAERTSFCTLRIALISRCRERSVILSRPISSEISMRRRATRPRMRRSFFVFLPRWAFVSARSLADSFSVFLKILAMFSMPSTVHWRYSSALSSSPASSACSEKVTTSRMLSFISLSSSPILMSSATAIGDREIAF